MNPAKVRMMTFLIMASAAVSELFGTKRARVKLCIGSYLYGDQ